MDKLKDILLPLVSLSAPSGYEDTITSYLKTELSLYKDLDVKEDQLGNLIVSKKGTNDQTIMLAAHCDEIGFAVKYIDESGYIYFSPIGGIDASILKGHSVIILHKNEPVNGIIGIRPAYLSSKTSYRFNNKEIDISDLWIDIGAGNKTTAMEMVSIGDPITFRPNFLDLHNDLFTSKSIDNRVGVAILLSVISKMQSVETRPNIVFVFSAQEELGLRGIITAGYSISPDIGIIVDVTHATDYPTVNKNAHGDIRLGYGPVIPIGSNFNNNIQNKLRKIASNNKFTIQAEAIPGYSGTEAAELQLLKGGCESGLLSIPCRYMHSPIETASYQDIQSAVDLLYEFCTNVN